MESSIFSDLKKIKIKPRLIVEDFVETPVKKQKNKQKNIETVKKIEETQPVQQLQPIQLPQQPTQQTQQSTNINDIVAKIHQSLHPFTDAKGYIYDTSTIVLECEKRHVHKYFVSDVENSQCLTCSLSDPIAKKVHDIAEELVKEPFIMREPTEFICMKYNIIIRVTTGFDSLDGNVISVHRTSSESKIKNVLNRFLSTFDMKILKKLKKTNKPVLYYPPELALAMGMDNVLNEPKLYFENC